MTATIAHPQRIKYRKLRITFSAVCGIVCLLLIVLCVRSYSWLDRVRIGKNHVTSLQGRLIANDVFNTSRTEPQLMASFSSHAFANDRIEIWSARRGALILVGVRKSIPTWPLVASVATIAVIPWLRWHFSLRTLLFGMAVIAALLGTVVWAVK